MAGTPGSGPAPNPDIYPLGLKNDELGVKLGGGIPKGSVVFIEGDEGSGRSVLSQRMLYGFLSNDRTATYISTEMTIRDFVDQMYSLNYRVDRHILTNKLSYFPVYPLLGAQAKSRDNFLQKLMSSAVLYRNDILFVDSMSTLVKASLEENGVLGLLGFLKKMSRQDKVVVMTAERGHKALEPLRLAADVYLSLDMKNVAGGTARIINVKRFARARGEIGDTVRFRIEARVGMIIEITEVSG